MITTEMAFDLLPYAVEIFEKLDLQDYIKNNSIDITGKDKKEAEIESRLAGINMIKYIVQNCSKIKEEVFSIISLTDGKTVQEIKEQNILVTINSFKSILGNKDLLDFFKSAMQ